VFYKSLLKNDYLTVAHFFTRLHCALYILFSDVKGNKKLADGPTRGSKKKRTDIPIIVHSYTTIMVHIAFTGGKTSNLSYRWGMGSKHSSAQGPLSSKIKLNYLVNFWKWRVKSS